MRVNREKGFEMDVTQETIDYLIKLSEELNKKICEEHGISYYSLRSKNTEKENQKQEVIVLDFDLG